MSVRRGEGWCGLPRATLRGRDSQRPRPSQERRSAISVRRGECWRGLPHATLRGRVPAPFPRREGPANLGRDSLLPRPSQGRGSAMFVRRGEGWCGFATRELQGKGFAIFVASRLDPYPEGVSSHSLGLRLRRYPRAVRPPTPYPKGVPASEAEALNTAQKSDSRLTNPSADNY